jgi:hypothetical protein
VLKSKDYDNADLFYILGHNGTCIKRWGLRASSLSAVAKVDAGQKTSNNHLAPNVLYMMLAVRSSFLH